MQDLEELKKEVESGEFTFSRSIALDLIASCESAEKAQAAANRIVGAMASDLGMITKLCGADENCLAIGAVRGVIAQRDELLAALKHLEVSANTVDYCYRKPSDKFSYSLLCLRDDAEKAREAIAKAVQPCCK